MEVAISILSLGFKDFSILNSKINELDNADYLHLDIMDGKFVKNKTISAKDIKKIKTKLKKHIHLMILNPNKNIDSFIKTASKNDTIIVHAEEINDKIFKKILKKLKRKKINFGISINPDTSVALIRKYLSEIDLILVMSVYPGFSGQKFIDSTLKKVKILNKIRKIHGWKYKIEIDGGINDKTARRAVNAGVDILAAGMFIFRNINQKKAIEILKRIHPLTIL